MSFKSFYGVYIAVAPLAILLILRFFLPNVENTVPTVAVVTEGPNAISEAVIARLDPIADVATYDSVERMEARLRGAGSAEGLYWDPETEQYVSVLERNLEANELFSVGTRAVRLHEQAERDPSVLSRIEFSATVPDAISGRSANSPVATMGGSIFVVFLVLIAGFLVGLSVVNDKELGTDRAVRVSPATRLEYYVGKSLFPVLLLLVYPIPALLVLELLSANIVQVYLVVFLSVTVALLIGLLVGAIAKNENEAIGIVKFLGVLMALGVLGGAILPEAWQWIAYWIPFYWMFDLLEEVFALAADWVTVLWKAGVMTGIVVVMYGLAARRISRGLS
jgi:hypothetical protein